MFTSSPTYSGTYTFAPTGGEVIAQAYSRIQIRRTAIEQEHIVNGLMELNLLLASLANLQVNLWEVDQQTINLVEGVATYTVPPETVMILDLFLRLPNTNPAIDRYMYAISRSEYSMLSNKSQQAPPNQYWFDRTMAPTITFYPVPDGNGPYTVYYYRVRQTQDAMLAGGMNLEIIYRFLDCVVAGLAYRLARIYSPQLEAQRKADSDAAWMIAARNDVENVPVFIMPGIGSYYR